MFSFVPLLLSGLSLMPSGFPAQPIWASVQEPQAAPASSAEVSEEERLKRTYIYSAGARYIVQLELDTAIEMEIQRRKDAGLSVGDVEISPEDLENEVLRRMEMVLAQDPTIDFWQLMHSEGFTQDTFAQEVRRSMIGQRMFFPLDPEDWPVEQIQEIMPARWEQDLHADHTKLLEMKTRGEFSMLNDGQLNQFLMPAVWQWLHKSLEIIKPSSGLPEGICLILNGKQYRTDDVLATIEPLLTDVDRQWAQTFLKNLELFETDLKASGHWLNQKEFEAYYKEEQGRYNEFFPHEQMVLQYYGFPSMESYRQYLRVRRSFRATLPASGTPKYNAMLGQIIQAHGPGLGGGRVQADVLLLSARDKATGKFAAQGDSFAAAKTRADEVEEFLVSGEPFDQILLEYSDYPPSVSGSTSVAAQVNRGRFENLQRHELRSFLNETDYTDFIFGYSVTDDIFFRAEQSAIYGPIMSPLGYSFFRVLGRKPQRKEIDMEGDPSVNWQVNEDLLTFHFLERLQELRK